ncbi:glycosyltransferase [Azomonas macrocytogenes]|uniref:Hopene-associated glycosyltransferase HpnB n=1 Tax=Azomonas macrocytogenes TaxID=69962 RepID=A0A839T5B5_AZOMA|nr:glycosyltransferase [Azomonas macrocytogenes]MBB3104711.1 hopene-associated glycosyltransferase HpnB [Azomonas macrocytogenes]
MPAAFAHGWAVVILPAVIWVGLLLLPWRPWSTRERLETDPQAALATDLSEITVLIPARNEAETIGTTLAALQTQGNGLQVVVVDDQSNDATASIAAAYPNTRVVSGQPLPEGWAGKLWALEQGKSHVDTPMILLLDADIQLHPGLLSALLAFKRREERHFVSLMADLRRTSFWDRLLLPTFVYYFKLLYPFALSNSHHRYVAAAAGGCVLVDTEVLQRIGAFASLRDALIDDCTLARQVKNAGYRTWLGLSRSVVSLRPYGSLASIHDMVARSAFTQLGYSTWLLLAVTMIFGVAYGGPFALLSLPLAWPWALIAWAAMTLSYLPILRYYHMSPLWALLLPLSAAFYLGMTWSSAIRYWRGVRSRWKGRVYSP